MDKIKEVYREAAGSGMYEKVTGMLGKYDNVRRYWEDEITRIFIRPFIAELVKNRYEEMKRIRILDLGCGSGDGLELLTSINAKEAGLIKHQVELLTPDILGVYRGLDISAPLIEQAREVHGLNGKVRFEVNDFSSGLPITNGEKGYDIYFTSYGTLSHLKDDRLVDLIADLARHAKNKSLLICDWLGHYSYEWRDLWREEEPDYTMDYVVSYIYPEEERAEKELDHLILRLMSANETRELIKKASDKSSTAINEKTYFDRSIFVGRHMDTGDYNSHCQPLRNVVNSLFEVNQRTNLDTLIADYTPKEPFGEINEFFEHFQMCWNALVSYTTELLFYFDREENTSLPEIPDSYPDVLCSMMHNMKNIVESCHWITVGDTRANIIEPQLGYALRELEMKLQKGLGCGHGLVGIYEIEK